MNLALNQMKTTIEHGAHSEQRDDVEQLWEAVVARDSHRDGEFVFAVSSTGIYCRPSCPSRRAKRERVSFFLTPEAAEAGGFRACKRCRPREARQADPQIELVRTACRLINQSEDQEMTLAELSEKLGVSSFHFQRTFKEVMGITPKQYAATRRVEKFKSGVRRGDSITSALYDAGYGSSSRLYENADEKLGMTPATYGKGGRGARIVYAIADSPLGKLLVAATSSGLCSVKLDDSAAKLEQDLREEFPAAEIKRDDQTLGGSVENVLNHLEGKQPHIDLPLDVRATAFQRQVWEQLRLIPMGQTRSYGEVARTIGQPTATRAVARACATNPVALVIPCHRVVREDKTLGGYRWGIERKKKLLEKEREAVRP
jgi:AraC family transcriptional regulator of adaptative response/methylated-DNA-[protein]-cysteine methyltransferase